VAPLVLPHLDLERAPLRAHRNRLQAPVDPDPVLQVDDVVARLERARRRRRRRRAVAPRPPEAPGATEDLMIGEDPEPGEDEPAVQCADRERRAVAAEQLLEALQLSLVV